MPDQAMRVLLIEDSPGDARLIELYLREAAGRQIEFDHATRMADGLLRLDEGATHAILLDLNLPDSEGIDTVRAVHAHASGVPIVVLTGTHDGAVGVEAIQNGAEDFLVKGRLDGELLIRTIRYTIERAGRRRAEEALNAAQQELDIARRIQKSLYPEVAPALPGYDIAAASFPAQAVGGDYFDFFPMLDGNLGVAIGDATGQGMGPALLMAEVRACLRTLAPTHHSVTEILTRANYVLTPGLPENHFITLLLSQLHTETGSFTYISAGHAPGFIMASTGELKATLESTGVPLGVAAESHVVSKGPALLDSGDLVLLLTDGLRQARSTERSYFGDERIMETVRQQRHALSRQIVMALRDAIRTHCQPQMPTDDFTAIVIKVK